MQSVRQLAAIMFTDIVGYTAMMQQDEADALQRIRRYRETIGRLVAEHGGQILQHYGDGTLTLFSSVVEAMHCARKITLGLSEEPRVLLRTGIHIGDVVRNGEEVYGDGVNIAARVQSIAPPGSILFTGQVWEYLRNQPDFSAKPLGKFSFKNVDAPLLLYALKGRGLPEVEPDRLTGDKGKPLELRIGNLQLSPRLVRWGSFVAGLIIMAAIVLHFWGRPALTGSSAGQVDKSIAVLPFQDFSPNHDLAHLCDGIAEEILNELTQIEGLKVAGRTSSFTYRDGRGDLRSIGRQLGVATVLEGSIRREGDRLRVTAQLINVSDGFHLWSQTYDRGLTDIFGLQREIAASVSQKLAGILLPSITTPQTGSRAYEAYLRGKHLLSQRADSLPEAVRYFNEAIALDSQFAPAYAGLSHTYLWLGWNNLLPSNEAFPKVRQYALTALQLDTSLAYTHALLGAVSLWYDWQWSAARIALERAKQKNPSEARAYLDLGWLEAISNHPDQALTLMHQAVAIDPLNLEYNLDLADIYRMYGRYDEARQQCLAMQRQYPNNSELAWMLGLIDFSQRRYPQAIAQFEKAVALSEGEPWATLYYLAALAASGQQQQASRQLDSLRQQYTLDTLAPVELAMVYLALDQKDKALSALQQAYQQRANWLISIGIDPVWNPLRTQPAFVRLITQMQFPT